MNYFNKMLKLFVKVPQVILSYIVLIVLSNVYMYKLLDTFLIDYQKNGAAATDALYFCGDIRYLCIVFFICWFFISFEFSRKVSVSPIKEVFMAFGKRGILPFINQIMIILLAIFLFTINMMIYAWIGHTRLNCPPQILEQLVKVLVVDVFFLSAASSGMGLLVSRVKRKFAGYAIFLFLILYMIPDYNSILQDGLSNFSGLLQAIHSIVCIMPQDISYTYDALYGLPFEQYRLLNMLFWIVLGNVAFIGFHFWEGKKARKIAVGICSLALLGLVIAIVNKGSVVRMDEQLRNVTSYYAENETRDEKASFRVKKYQIDFRIDQALTADCKMELEGDINRPSYLFTLYHNYIVKHVYNGEGEKMDFEQQGDYITITADKPTQSITMNYSGSGDVFYSNQNACFLPGFFPYYPRAGAVKIFDGDQMQFLSCQEEKTEYDVSVKSFGKIFTNLSKKGERYQGQEDNLTIISGNYETVQKDSVTYVTLPMQKSSEWVSDKITQPFVVAIPSSTTFLTLLDNGYVTDSCLFVRDREFIEEEMK